MTALRPRSRRCKSDLADCQDCKVVLTNENWTPSMQKQGRRICGPCWVNRQRRYKEGDPLSKQKLAAWRNARRASWDDDRREQERLRRYDASLKRNYGIGIAEYNSMLAQQNGKCAICLGDAPLGKGTFHVDHCHSSGKVRKLLCTKCNMMLGLSGDRPEVLLAAAAYLKSHKTEF